MNSGAAGQQPPDAPVPLQLLADLQAGVLDDDTAARLRHRVRTDPQVAQDWAALDQARRALADLGDDAESAPPVPADVTARIGAALRDAAPHHPPPIHAARRPLPRLRALGAALGAVAVVLAAALGAIALGRDPAPTRPAGPTARHITVSQPAGDITLSDPQILGLLAHRPDLGPLADPQRRASCLRGLGYPVTTTVLGARTVDVKGRPGVLLLLPGDTPRAVVALVVGPTCSSADTGLLTETIVHRP